MTAPTPGQRRVAVAIIEDQPEIRDGLRILLNRTTRFACGAVFRCMEEAIAAFDAPHATLPEIVLVDLALPGISGVEGIALLKDRHPKLHLIVLTIYDDDRRIFQALCAGASGYLLKKTPPARLLQSLSDVIEGGSPISPEVATRVLALFRDTAPPKAASYYLTPHEMRLLRLLSEGHTYKTAAAELRCTVHTIGFHIRNIYSKLQVHSKSEAVAKALRHKLFR